MPKLFDMLSESNDKALRQLQKKMSEKKIKKNNRSKKTRGTHRQNNKRNSIYIPDFIAIDFETTGLDFKNNRIIEIGAVKFLKGKPSAEYSTLINPGQAIPSKITELTGITDDKVKDAPGFSNVVDELMSFIDKYPLCGHQVDFDYSFLTEELKRVGKNKIKNAQLDTAVLSRLMLFDLPGYSLSNVCAHLDISLQKAHRALDDAKASGQIACILIPKLESIPEDIRMILGYFAPYSLLKSIIMKSIGKIKKVPLSKPTTSSSLSYKRLSMPEEPERIDKNSIEDCFSKKGRLSQLLENYSLRSTQIKMALHVISALNSQNYLVAEAGTGIGKTMAYLIPAAIWAVRNNCRILVSTHTKNLQDQLVIKDLPIVKKLVNKGFKYSILKGRSNYLCKHRWNRFLNGEIGNFSIKERNGMLPLIRWAEETKTGDIESQNQFNIRWYVRVWALVSADSYGCLGKRCPEFNSCFLQNARRRALSSHIVVINHALFFSEICAESSFLGKIGTIIFDEAHHIESSGHRFLRVDLDTNRLNRYLDSLNNLVKIMERVEIDEKNSTGFRDSHKKYKKTLKRLRKYGVQFLNDVSSWAKNRPVQVETNGFSTYLHAYSNDNFKRFPSFAGFQIELNDIQDILISLQQSTAEQMEDVNSTIYNDISICLEKTSQLKADSSYLTNASLDDHVFWIEGDKTKGWVKLCGVPLDIGHILSEIWKSNRGSVIFTSATISVSETFDYFKHNAGLLDEINEMTQFKIFSSPFESDQMYKTALDTCILPGDKGFDDYVSEIIVKLLNKFNKNIIVLFTAHTMLNNVYSALHNRDDLPENSNVYAQGISGSRTVIFNNFKESKNSVLLGTSSFWEGIDAPGKTCELVIIPRLPFPVPTHPLTQALAEKARDQFGDSFFGFSIPEAVIKFRQGAGRLIRSADDRGVLLVLDGRIINKGYGKVFLKSLDGDFIKRTSVHKLLDDIDSFFKHG
ncbi:MAG: helicase C-terminal domain-containing protein [Chitinispirillia bacterium]|jgi:predicted DnaQ family exonuclease/DinG family helicase